MRRLVDRGRRTARSYRAWRAAILSTRPLCVSCAADGLTVAATELHHVTPLHEGGPLMDEANVEGLCGDCHTARHAPAASTAEDGAWSSRLAAL